MFPEIQKIQVKQDLISDQARYPNTETSYDLPFAHRIAVKFDKAIDADPVLVDVYGWVEYSEKNIDSLEIHSICLTNTRIELNALFTADYIEQLTEWLLVNKWQTDHE